MNPYVCVVGAVNLDICGRPSRKLIFRDSNPGTVTLTPGGVGRNIAHDLRLLEHDLANPHEVRVVDASPGKLAPQRHGQRAHARLECLHTLGEQGFHAKGTAEAVGGVFGCLHIACGRQSRLRYFHSRISQPSLLAWQRSMTSGFTAWAVWAIWSMGASVWWSP